MQYHCSIVHDNITIIYAFTWSSADDCQSHRLIFWAAMILVTHQLCPCFHVFWIKQKSIAFIAPAGNFDPEAKTGGGILAVPKHLKRERSGNCFGG